MKREYCINFLALTDELEHLYHLEVAYGTLASLYGNALREHIITKEIYDEAIKATIAALDMPLTFNADSAIAQTFIKEQTRLISDSITGTTNNAI